MKKLFFAIFLSFSMLINLAYAETERFLIKTNTETGELICVGYRMIDNRLGAIILETYKDSNLPEIRQKLSLASGSKLEDMNSVVEVKSILFLDKENKKFMNAYQHYLDVNKNDVRRIKIRNPIWREFVQNDFWKSVFNQAPDYVDSGEVCLFPQNFEEAEVFIWGIFPQRIERILEEKYTLRYIDSRNIKRGNFLLPKELIIVLPENLALQVLKIEPNFKQLVFSIRGKISKEQVSDMGVNLYYLFAEEINVLNDFEDWQDRIW